MVPSVCFTLHHCLLLFPIGLLAATSSGRLACQSLLVAHADLCVLHRLGGYVSFYPLHFQRPDESHMPFEFLQCHGAISCACCKYLVASLWKHHRLLQHALPTLSLHKRHEHVACMQALQCLQNWNAEGLSAAQKHLTTAQSELASMSTTSHPSDTPTPGFHPDVNRRLLGPLPPRPVQVSGKVCTIIYNYRSSSNNAGHLLYVFSTEF